MARVEKEFQSRYQLVKVAARRARQLQQGATPMVPLTSTKACRVAQDEIRAGHVQFVVKDAESHPDANTETRPERQIEGPQ